MKRVGAHVSTAGGVRNAPVNAAAIGAKAFALFVQNPRQWKPRPLSAATIDAFARAMEQGGFLPRHVVPHVNYLINLGHPDPDIRQKSFESFLAEMARCQMLGLSVLNFHPGSHPGETGDRECATRIADSVNSALERTRGVTALLENMAGQGSSVAHTFEQLAVIIDMIEDKQRVGVCFDTCHAFAAGYDLRTREGFNACFTAFDRIIGISRLKAFHLNDAKSTLGSRVDRHESLGKGNLGLAPFSFIMNDPRFDELPLILETVDDTLWPQEIKMLYGMVSSPD